MRLSGIMLISFLVLSVLTINTADATPQKYSIKKDIKDFKTMQTDKSAQISKISKSRTLHVWHIVEVKVCAGMEKLYSPDLELRSDRDVVQVTLWGLIMPKSCKSGEFFIAADDPNSISIVFSTQSYSEPTR
ncbi:hypothetical protein [Candidatus Nitrosotenuis cloacae]|uniref:Uncharacterized protein n=1 Tax=Candidatus Nitrosotenuis cloacae TaxID=1603555 RepID=A0A3G1B106_9ARCH|nr:hypothetical protein [Candidatus Nitrosotenuis cloacae]AJZ75419.1 hypothetical protein SU86_002360 [Candidatus Nitrosotenuis cloacae]